MFVYPTSFDSQEASSASFEAFPGQSGHPHQGDVLPSEAVLAETLRTVTALLPLHWKFIQDREGFHALCLSRNNRKNISIQRVVYASFDGAFDIFIHRKELLGSWHDDVLRDLVFVPLNSTSLKVFADNVIQVVNRVRKYEICAGVDLPELADLWPTDNLGKIDENPYDESRYERTFRSHDCAYLVPLQHWRCQGCSRVYHNQTKRKKTALKEELHKNTRNDYLNEDVKRAKFKSLQKDFQNAKRKIDHLQSQVTKLMNQESVPIDNDLSENLTEILRD